jgi:hypothetical protein
MRARIQAFPWVLDFSLQDLSFFRPARLLSIPRHGSLPLIERTEEMRAVRVFVFYHMLSLFASRLKPQGREVKDGTLFS